VGIEMLGVKGAALSDSWSIMEALGVLGVPLGCSVQRLTEPPAEP